MKSDLPKVLHSLRGKPLLSYVLETARGVRPSRIVVVVGHEKELVISKFKDAGCEFAVQDRQLGSGHAAQVAERSLNGFSGDVLVLSGDVPLLRTETLKTLLEVHSTSGSVLSLISCELPDPGAYGRILQNGSGKIRGIVEAADASAEERRIKEINSGIYVFQKEFLFRALRQVSNANSQGEYYLTDVVHIASREGKGIACHRVENPWEIQGVNTVSELNALEEHLAASARPR